MKCVLVVKGIELQKQRALYNTYFYYYYYYSFVNTCYPNLLWFSSVLGLQHDNGTQSWPGHAAMSNQSEGPSTPQH